MTCAGLRATLSLAAGRLGAKVMPGHSVVERQKMEIQLEGEYAEEDVRRAVALSRPPWFAPLRLVFSLALSVPAAWMGVSMVSQLLVQPFDLALLAAVLIPIFLYLMFFAALIFFLWVQPVLAVRRLAGSPLFRGGFSGWATSDGLELGGPFAMSKVRWDAFIDRKLGTDLILLFRNETAFSIVPRRFLTSDEDWSRLQERVRDAVPEKERPRLAGLRWVLYGIVLLVVLFGLVFGTLGIDR